MSIQSEIQRIQNNVDNSIAAVAAYGVTVPANATSDDLPGLIAQITEKVINKDNLSLGIASDGLIYIFVDGTPVGTGIPQGQSGDVFVYIDENSNIVLSGNVPDGTYTASFEKEDGTIVSLIGQLVKDTKVYYSVTSNLTNCTNSNSTKSVVAGGSYSATITAKDGYELKTVTATMGGSAVTVTNGTINISNVTGNIVITASAEEKSNNLLPNATNADGTPYVGDNGEKGYRVGYRIKSTGEEVSAAGIRCTGFIPTTGNSTDCIYIKNIELASSNNAICFYDANHTKLLQSSIAGAGYAWQELEDGVWRIGPLNQITDSVKNSTAYFRFCCGSITDDTIVTVNEPIE